MEVANLVTLSSLWLLLNVTLTPQSNASPVNFLAMLCLAIYIYELPLLGNCRAESPWQIGCVRGDQFMKLRFFAVMIEKTLMINSIIDI